MVYIERTLQNRAFVQITQALTLTKIPVFAKPSIELHLFSGFNNYNRVLNAAKYPG